MKECERNNEKLSWYERGYFFGWFIDADSNIFKTTACDRCDGNINVFATKAQAEGARALAMLSTQLDAVRAGWKPCYNDGEPKWMIEYHYRGLCVNPRINHSQRGFLAFPTKQMASVFLKTNRELIKQAGVFLWGEEIE